MEKFIVAAETALRISDSQQGDTTLVLLHGYLESLEVWEDFTKLLTPYYRVIAIDIPGHGISEVRGEVHSMEFVADVLKGVLDKQGVARCFVAGPVSYTHLWIAKPTGSVACRCRGRSVPLLWSRCCCFSVIIWTLSVPSGRCPVSYTNLEYLRLNRGINSVVNIDLREVIAGIDFNTAQMQTYPPGRGFAALRDAINAEYFGGESSRDNLLIVPGAMNGLDLLAQSVDIERLLSLIHI